MNSNTAILVFVNSAQKESAQKPMPGSLTIFESLNKKTITTVKRTGIPYFIVTEKEQVGLSFGIRFRNAFFHVFEQGFNNVIAIGNDTPQLRVKDLMTASQELTKGKCVLGPSLDGGIYLLGIPKKVFTLISLEQLPWQKNYLESTIFSEFEVRGQPVVRLHRLLDIDSTKDLFDFICFASRQKFSLLKLILSLLHTIQPYTIFVGPIDGLVQKDVYFNKGSPFFLSL